MATNNILSRLINVASVTIFCAVVIFFATSFSYVAGQETDTSETVFCSIESPLLARVTNAESETIEDKLRNTIIVENMSDKHIGGVNVAVGVFTGDDLTHLYVAETDKSIPPNSRDATIFSVDTSVLPAGDYTYQVVAEQGDVSSIISALILNNDRNSVPITKTSDSTDLLQTEIVINSESVGAGESVQLKVGESISIETATINTSALPLFDVEVDVLLTENDVPFGDAVVSYVHDEAKLFPGSKRVTKSIGNSVLQGPFSVFVTQHIPDTLMPLLHQDIQVGSIESHGYATRMSRVGVGERVNDSELEVAVCLEELRSGETHRDRVESVAIQLTQPETDYNSDILSNVNNVVEVLTTMPIMNDDVNTSVALLAVADNSSNGQLLTKQKIDFTFDCELHNICFEEVVEAAVEFTQTDAAQTTFWFYGGIAVAALLMLFLIVSRVRPTPAETVEMHMPEEDV